MSNIVSSSERSRVPEYQVLIANRKELVQEAELYALSIGRNLGENAELPHITNISVKSSESQQAQVQPVLESLPQEERDKADKILEEIYANFAEDTQRL